MSNQEPQLEGPEPPVVPEEPLDPRTEDPGIPREVSSAQPATAWSRLRRMGRPRATRANLIAAILALALGFAMVTQVRATRTSGLESLRQGDLVSLLANVNNQSTRLQREYDGLVRTRDQLKSGGSDAAAIKAGQDRLDTLGILAGTVAATGPGIKITIKDSGGAVSAPNVLDAVEELRDAGAEAIQIGDVRVVASTWFGTADGGRLLVDGQEVQPPYTVLAIGDAHTMSTAMAIPGGVVESLAQIGATATVTERKTLTVSALRPLSQARYAQPDDSGS